VADVGVLVVHGMGTQPPDFAARFATDVGARLAGLQVDSARVAWGAGHWADILAAGQREVWKRSLAAGRMDFQAIRRFVLDALGDAVAYRRTDVGVPGGTPYERVHERLHDVLAALRQQVGGDRPLVVVAHSLGSVIVSDYIWNAQRDNAWALGRTAFARMRTLCGLVTFGSTLPLFSLALPAIEAIAFPPPELAPPLRAVAEWNNYYDRDDVLGWPLRELSPSYRAAVTADHEIAVGSWLTGWNPAAHAAYWTDASFLDPVARQIARVLQAVPPEAVPSAPRA
jgi:alpha-beta hydrolase superfamily lysophospholipase